MTPRSRRCSITTKTWLQVNSGHSTAPAFLADTTGLIQVTAGTGTIYGDGFSHYGSAGTQIAGRPTSVESHGVDQPP